jgi:hypothetical protein
MCWVLKITQPFVGPSVPQFLAQSTTSCDQVTLCFGLPPQLNQDGCCTRRRLDCAIDCAMDCAMTLFSKGKICRI